MKKFALFSILCVVFFALFAGCGRDNRSKLNGTRWKQTSPIMTPQSTITYDGAFSYDRSKELTYEGDLRVQQGNVVLTYTIEWSGMWHVQGDTLFHNWLSFYISRLDTGNAVYEADEIPSELDISDRFMNVFQYQIKTLTSRDMILRDKQLTMTFQRK